MWLRLDFTINEMQEMQRNLQDKYKDKWETIDPETGKIKVWYIVLNGFLIKIQILNIKTAIIGLWNGIYEYHKGFVLINEKKSTMFEFGSDSRDEENYLFDKYPLIQ